MSRIKTFVIAMLVLVGAMIFTACSDVPVVPVPVADEEAVSAAVEATLTAVAADAAPQANPAATPTPAQSEQTVQLPPPVPDWESFAQKPETSRGDAAAPVVLVEYSDFACPWCGRFHSEVLPTLAPLIEAGDLRFVYKHFPVLGPDSVTTALATECAADQGDFWSLHDWLFDNQSAWKGSGNARQQVLDAAAELGYDADALAACMDSDATDQAVAADFQETQQLGFRGTPSFILNGRLIPGFLPAETFDELISVSLSEATSGALPAGYALAPTPVPPDTDFEAEEFAVQGALDAPVTIVEFSDYQCPFCQRFFQETKPLIDQEYVDTGKVRFVYKDFPIDSIHAQARPAAEAAECAGEQGAYWAMHDRIFEGKDEWAENPDAAAIFKGYATELGLDTAQFDACFNEGVYAAEVQTDLEEGQRAGVTGTPAFFINGRKVEGAQPFSVFQQIIEDELSGE
jgi:protein-disulfide isomerase